MALLENTLAHEAHLPITPAEAMSALHTGVWGDESALKLCVQDALKAEAHESTKAWVAGWPQASTLYQSPHVEKFWEGTTTSRASVPFYTVANAVNSLVPQIISGLFYETPPFMLQPRPKTTALEAEAVGAVLSYQLDEINFREELRLGVMNAVLFGTNIWKWGWESYTHERKVLVRKQAAIQPNPIAGGPAITIYGGEDDVEEEVTIEQIERPTFEHIVNLRHILVDPTLNVPDISKAKYVIHRMYMTWEDLDKLRDRPGYDIPSREKLLELFLPPREPVEANPSENMSKNPQWDMRAEARYEQDTTVDPFIEPLEVLERWTNDTCIVVLQKKAVIYNGANDYGKLPFLSVGWWDCPDAFFSLGLAKTIGSEQRLQQGIVNTWLDGTALNLNGVYTRIMGQGVPTQSIRIAPGKVLNISKENELVPLDRLPAVPEAGEHIQMSQSRVDQLAGAGAFNTQGASAGSHNIARTATGANMLQSSSTTAPDFIDKLSNQIIIPLLINFHEMNFSLLPQATMRRILNDELEHEYTASGKDILNLYNARMKFSILAGAKMQARRQMQAQLPIMIQFLTNEQTVEQMRVAGYRVDTVRVMRDVYEASEWKDVHDVIVKMTPEEQQRADMNSPAAQQMAQMQQQNAIQDKKHEQQLEVINSENIARAGREVLRHAMENSETPQVLTGDAGKDSSFTQG